MKHLLFLSACGVATALSLSTAQAAAPPRLVSSTPAKGSHVPWPKQIILKFDEPVAQAGLQVEMIKPDGGQIPLEAPIVSKTDRSALAEVKSPTLPGPYMVMWRARSEAGSAASGDYTFFVQ